MVICIVIPDLLYFNAGSLAADSPEERGLSLLVTLPLLFSLPVQTLPRQFTLPQLPLSAAALNGRLI